MNILTVMRGPDHNSSARHMGDFITSSVDSARRVELPFYHFELDERVFPEDVYASMLAAMPVAADYRPLRGRTGACVIA
jgi:hypothetical protein